MAPQGVLDKLLDFGFSNIDLWRSEEMEAVRLLVPTESAHDTVAALGEIGLLQFKDMNEDKSAFQRTYANQVKRCDEMARRLRFFQEQVDKAGLKVLPAGEFRDKVELDALEGRLEELERDLINMNENSERLDRTYNELNELQVVLEKGGSFFDNAKASVRSGFGRELSGVTENPDAPLLQESGGVIPEKVARVGFVAGTIAADRVNGFERLLFRATRGNMFLRQGSVGKVKDPVTNETMDKHVFVIFFSGDRSRTKIMKICEAFGANRYPFPDEPSRQREMQTEVTARLRELHTTLEASGRHRDALLQELAKNLDYWTTVVRREKAVYHTLNKMSVDVTSKVLIAEAWVPSVAKAEVQAALRESAANSSTQLSVIMQNIPAQGAPPTYYRTNKFTQAFQNIVDSYGVARYREVNPAVLTIMTFPFLFSVMFGDVGHAILMCAFAGFLCIKEKQLAKQDLGDMLTMLFGGRYVILLMGIFSIYLGFIYNEFFSMPMQIFGGTRFKCYHDNDYSEIIDSVTGVSITDSIDPRDCLAMYGGVLKMPPGTAPVVFGMDPIWHGRKTELSYLNSLKMKMSILIGVTHMDFGIINNLYNNIFFRDSLSTWCEFIPQMIFLNFLFGYLCILIVIKWCTGKLTDLYHVMIYMFLSPGSGPEDPKDELIPGQGGLQLFLLLVALFAVPWMLLPKPLVLKKRHEAMMAAKGHSAVEMSQNYGALADDEESRHRPHGGGHGSSGDGHGHGGGHGDHGHGDHFEFGEIMVHQMIHTIEFVLGAVSNTASYLRLWALSLAHSQLASVFYDRVLMAFISSNPVLLFIAFFVFACATLGVLMVMESLSAFLHALRLHWVEYQGKFYKGDGYRFAPFSFKNLTDD